MFQKTLPLQKVIFKLINMKKIAALALALLAMPTFAQKYSITGQVPKELKKVYLYNFESKNDQTPDSVVVKDGRFSFSGDAQGKLFAMLFAKDGEYSVPVVLDGDVKVDLVKKVLAGTSENEKLSAALQQLESNSAAMQSVMSEVRKYQEEGKEMPESLQQRLESAYEAAIEGLVANVKKICDANMQSIFPAYFISSYFNSMDKADIIRYADSNASFMNVGMLKRLRASVEGWKRQQPGVMFTDIELADTAGVQHKLSEYVGKGNYVLIDFWASWCGPCMREMPQVKALYDKYHSKGFDIVGLSFDREHKNWVGAIKRKGLNWHHLSDLKYWDTIAGRTYGVNSIPATLLIGPDGKIVAANLHGEELAAKLKEIYE